MAALGVGGRRGLGGAVGGCGEGAVGRGGDGDAFAFADDEGGGSGCEDEETGEEDEDGARPGHGGMVGGYRVRRGPRGLGGGMLRPRW